MFPAHGCIHLVRGDQSNPVSTPEHCGLEVHPETPLEALNGLQNSAYNQTSDVHTLYTTAYNTKTDV